MQKSTDTHAQSASKNQPIRTGQTTNKKEKHESKVIIPDAVISPSMGELVQRPAYDDLMARVMENPKFIDAEFMQMNLGDYVCIGQGLEYEHLDFLIPRSAFVQLLLAKVFFWGHDKIMAEHRGTKGGKEFVGWVKKYFRTSRSVAYRLIRIAPATHLIPCAGFLPCSSEKLERLAAVPADVFKRLVEKGIINAQMENKDIDKVLKIEREASKPSRSQLDILMDKIPDEVIEPFMDSVAIVQKVMGKEISLWEILRLQGRWSLAHKVDFERWLESHKPPLDKAA